MKNIEIRQPLPEDKNELHLLFETVIRHTFKINSLTRLEKMLDLEIKDKKNCLNQYYETEGRERFFLIALVDNRIVGCIEYGMANVRVSNCTNGELAGITEVGTVFVIPEYQKRGIGRLLLDSIFSELSSRNIRKVCLDSGYKMAQKIWLQKFGQPEYFLKDYWGEGLDHMIWVLEAEKDF